MKRLCPIVSAYALKKKKRKEDKLGTIYLAYMAFFFSFKTSKWTESG
jgi:hypothetical protein